MNWFKNQWLIPIDNNNSCSSTSFCRSSNFIWFWDCKIHWLKGIAFHRTNHTHCLACIARLARSAKILCASESSSPNFAVVLALKVWLGLGSPSAFFERSVFDRTDRIPTRIFFYLSTKKLGFLAHTTRNEFLEAQLRDLWRGIFISCNTAFDPTLPVIISNLDSKTNFHHGCPSFS